MPRAESMAAHEGHQSVSGSESGMGSCRRFVEGIHPLPHLGPVPGPTQLESVRALEIRRQIPRRDFRVASLTAVREAVVLLSVNLVERAEEFRKHWLFRQQVVVL